MRAPAHHCGALSLESKSALFRLGGRICRQFAVMQRNNTTIHHFRNPILPVTLYGIISVIGIDEQKISWFAEAGGHFVAKALQKNEIICRRAPPMKPCNPFCIANPQPAFGKRIYTVYSSIRCIRGQSDTRPSFKAANLTNPLRSARMSKEHL